MTTTEEKTNLKYRIKEKLNLLSRYKRLELQQNILAEIGCSYNMYHKMISAEVGTYRDIKGTDLKIFAKHLGCSVDELYNDEVQSIVC